MLIGDLSKKFNIPIETLRYYDSIGILTPKRKNGNRDYTDQDISKLKFLLSMKKLFFTLSETKNILKLDEKLDSDLNNNILDPNLVKELISQVQLKYNDILLMEEELNTAKKRIEEIISKSEVLINELNSK